MTQASRLDIDEYTRITITIGKRTAADTWLVDCSNGREGSVAEKPGLAEVAAVVGSFLEQQILAGPHPGFDDIHLTGIHDADFHAALHILHRIVAERERLRASLRIRGDA
jgi:hypothetical protein